MKIRPIIFLTALLLFSVVNCLQAEKIKIVRLNLSLMQGSTITDQDSKEIKKAFGKIYLAMLEGNSNLLSNLLSNEFKLIHMTGKVQPKKEWLQDMDSRLMVYHSRNEVSNQIAFSKEGATLTGRDRVDATIYGGRGTWNLQLKVEFKKVNGTWIAQKMEASTF